MTCMDCGMPAVGICMHCGAAICRDHMRLGTDYRTEVEPIGPARSPVAVKKRARRLWCSTCGSSA